MGLFDKIKKTAPTVGATAAAGAAAAAGAYASQAFAQNPVPDDQNTDSGTSSANPDDTSLNSPMDGGFDGGKTESSSFLTRQSRETDNVEQEAQSPMNKSPEMSFDPDTGIATHRYPNGNTLTEHPDGTRAWHDAASNETTVYNPETGESTTYESDGDVVTKSPDGSQVTVEADGDVFYQDSEGKTSKIGETLANELNWDCTPDLASAAFASDSASPVNELLTAVQNGTIDSNTLIQALGNQIGMSPETSQLLNELSTEVQNGNIDSNTLIQTLGSQAGLSPETTQLMNELSTAAQNGTLDSNTLIQTLGKQVGINLEGKSSTAYEVKAGWEANYNKSHTGSDEIASGVGLNSEASYKASFFTGAYSKGEAGAEWSSEQAQLHAHTRSMIGVEASQEANYKGTLDIEAVDYQPGVEANGYTRGFAGAELEGKVDAVISKDSAQARVGAEGFAGAKVEAGGSGALSIDGNDFARAEGRAGAWAGAGADIGADVGYQDGQINFGMNAGAALGVGYGYEYDVSVDAPGIVTHPDAVWESAVEEASSYLPEIPDYSTEPPTIYTTQAVEDATQQVQEYVSIPEEVSQVAEVISDSASVIEDIGSSFGF